MRCSNQHELLLAAAAQLSWGLARRSETVWEPVLPDYMYAGGVNVLWLAFVHPAKMPALPPAMQHVSLNRPNGTLVIPSVGGEAYSDSAQWPWLASIAAAEAMAAEVVQWKAKYGCARNLPLVRSKAMCAESVHLI